MNETKKLAAYLSGLTYDDLSPEAVTQAKKALLDWLGLTIAGARELAPTLLRNILLPNDRGTEATAFVPYGVMKKSALNAAFVNGAASHSLDFDDLHNPSIIHLACVVMGPALAMAEREGRSGKELLAAIAAGYELGGRVGESVLPDSYYFWHTTGTVGTMAAAAAAASLLKLDADHFTHAIGSAGTQAAGLWEFLKEGAMSKPLHAGKACYGGVLSALLAEKGFTGATHILEGEKGFCRAMMRSPKLEKLTEHLGEDFKIAHNSIKPYPCCKHSHAALYGTKKLMADHHLAVEDISKITLKVNDITNSLINNPAPETPYGCKFSIQYCTAVMARKGSVGVADFRETAVKDQATKDFMKKVQVVLDPHLTEIYNAHPDQLASTVVIEMKDGSQYSLFVPYPKGDPENPMTLADIAAKGHGLADPFIGAKKYDALVDWVQYLEDVKDVGTSLAEWIDLSAADTDKLSA